MLELRQELFDVGDAILHKGPRVPVLVEVRVEACGASKEPTEIRVTGLLGEAIDGLEKQPMAIVGPTPALRHGFDHLGSGVMTTMVSPSTT
jgi:hypothetical protein